MKSRLINLLALALMTTLSTSCMFFVVTKTTWSDQIYQADTLEIPIPSYENPTIVTDKDDIQVFLNIIKDSDWEIAQCFCGGNMNIFFKQGTNIVATINVKHEGENLEWHDGVTISHDGESRSYTARTSLTKSSSDELVGYFEGIEKDSDIPLGSWKKLHSYKRPRMPLEPLSQERLMQMHEYEMIRANNEGIDAHD